MTDRSSEHIHVIAEPAKGICSGYLSGLYRFVRRWSLCRGIRAIITIRATPQQIALGVAVGAFIAFSPLIGIQTILAALAASVLGASRKAAMIAVWISNPVTMGPIFAITYQIGRALGDSTGTAAASWEVAGQAVNAPMRSQGLGQFVQASGGVIGPMFLGGAVLGLLAAVIAYRLTHRGVAAFQGTSYRRRAFAG